MKSKKIIRYIFAAVFLCILVFSLFKVFTISKSFVDIDKELKQVQTEFIANDRQGDKNDREEDEPLVIKWDELLAKNGDVLAWIDIPGTNISYPVVQGKDNDEYLRHNLYRQYSKTGTIFVDYSNANPFRDFNTVVYGHNIMNNKSMFSELKKFSEQSFADKYNSVFIYFPDNSFLEYKVFSFHKIDAANSPLYDTSAENTSDFLAAVTKNNTLSTAVNENEISSVLTLSTCTNLKENQRYVLHAVLMGENTK